MIKQLIVVLAIAGVVLCRDNQQQQGVSPEAVNELVDKFNVYLEAVENDKEQDGSELAKVLHQIKQHPHFNQVMSIMASEPTGDEGDSESAFQQVISLMPDKFEEDDIPMGQFLFQLMLWLKYGSAGR